MAESEFTAVAPLDGGNDRSAFDCGVPALNLYLRNYALQNQKKGIVRNYVTTHADSETTRMPKFKPSQMRANRVMTDAPLE